VATTQSDSKRPVASQRPEPGFGEDEAQDASLNAAIQ
jgi:hypothetical protein